MVPTGLEAAAALARAALYLGLSLAVGVVLVTVTTATPWRRLAGRSPDPAADPVAGPATVGAMLLGAAPLVMLELQRQSLEMTRLELPILLFDTPWGAHWMQLAAACVMTAGMLVVMGWRPRIATGTGDLLPQGRAGALAPILASVGAVAVAATMSGLGHAAADSAWPRLSRMADSLHALAAATWIGGLALTAWVARHRDDDESALGWSRFSRVATIAAPLVVCSAAVSSWRRLGGPAPESLWGALATPYGQLLVAKALLVLVMLGIGARQRQRIMARKRTDLCAIGAELLVALLVFGVTAVLTGTEPPLQRP